MDFYQGTTLLGSDTSAPYSFAWNNVGAGNYSLTAVATDNSGATTTSAPVAITVNSPAGLPAPWLDQDVGAVGPPGSVTYSNGTFTVVGSGTNIYGTADAFHFVSQPMSGDGEIVARVASVENTTNNSKGGIMIRDSLAADSSNVAHDHHRRESDPVPAQGFDRCVKTSNYSGYQPTPEWLRLVRSGNTFTAYRSANGDQLGTVRRFRSRSR